MRGKRMWQTFRLYTMLGEGKRTKYLKEKKVFAEMGEHCSIMDRKVPLYANLIKLGNNVHIASKVDFIAHDIAHVMINGMPQNIVGGYSDKGKNRLYRGWRQCVYWF